MAADRISVTGALEWYVSQHRWPNEAMYHYTSREAFENIVTKRQMRATDLRAMNDPEELRYGSSLIEERMRRAVRRAHNELRETWLRTVYQQFIELMADKSSSFAISFSEYPDMPSQWRKYAADGQGFVLGWSIDSSYAPMPLQTWVTYERNEQKALIDGLIKFHLEYIGSAVREERETPQEAFANAGLSLGMFLNIVLQTFKHKKCAPEAEFRYVYQLFHGYEPPDVYKTRTVGGVTKRYIEADFSTADLLYVVVGPLNDLAATELWLRDFLDVRGFQKTKIVRSSVTNDDLLHLLP